MLIHSVCHDAAIATSIWIAREEIHTRYDIHTFDGRAHTKPRSRSINLSHYFNSTLTWWNDWASRTGTGGEIELLKKLLALASIVVRTARRIAEYACSWSFSIIFSGDCADRNGEHIGIGPRDRRTEAKLPIITIILNHLQEAQSAREILLLSGHQAIRFVSSGSLPFGSIGHSLHTTVVWYRTNVVQRLKVYN